MPGTAVLEVGSPRGGAPQRYRRLCPSGGGGGGHNDERRRGVATAAVAAAVSGPLGGFGGGAGGARHRRSLATRTPAALQPATLIRTVAAAAASSAARSSGPAGRHGHDCRRITVNGNSVNWGAGSSGANGGGPRRGHVSGRRRFIALNLAAGVTATVFGRHHRHGREFPGPAFPAGPMGGSSRTGSKQDPPRETTSFERKQ